MTEQNTALATIEAAVPGLPAERIELWRRVLGESTPPEQLVAAIAICARYDLDPVLRHVIVARSEARGDYVVIVSRDALLHVAHRSGAFDGMEVEEPRLEADPASGEKQWVTTATVYRKDMAHPFRLPGRYPMLRTRARWERRAGQNIKVGEVSEPHPYGPEMAIKRAEARALRRAFSIAIGASGVDETIAVEDDDWSPSGEPAALLEPAPAEQAGQLGLGAPEPAAAGRT